MMLESSAHELKIDIQKAIHSTVEHPGYDPDIWTQFMRTSEVGSGENGGGYLRGLLS